MSVTMNPDVVRVAMGTDDRAAAEELLRREAARRLKAGLYKALPELSPEGQEALIKFTKALLGMK